MNSRTTTTVMTAQIAFSPMPLNNGSIKYNKETNDKEIPTFSEWMTLLLSSFPTFQIFLHVNLPKLFIFSITPLIFKQQDIFFPLTSIFLKMMKYTSFMKAIYIYICAAGILGIIYLGPPHLFIYRKGYTLLYIEGALTGFLMKSKKRSKMNLVER